VEGDHGFFLEVAVYGGPKRANENSIDIFFKRKIE